MKVDPDILSIHRGLLLFARGLVVEAPSLQQELGTFTGSGGPAPSSHQIWARYSSQTAIDGASRRALSVAVERSVSGVYVV